ncbi:MAG: hypothetical protein V1843_04615 [bacterium]
MKRHIFAVLILILALPSLVSAWGEIMYSHDEQMLRYGMGLAILEKSLTSAENILYLEMLSNKKLTPQIRKELEVLEKDIEGHFGNLSNYSAVVEYEETYLHFKAAYKIYRLIRDGQDISKNNDLFNKEINLGKAKAPIEYKTAKDIVRTKEID